MTRSKSLLMDDEEKRAVKQFWEMFPCELQYAPKPYGKATRELFDYLEKERYDKQAPFLHSFIQFTRWYGKSVLEIGVGVGTDFTQMVRAGARAIAVDLTVASAELVRDRLKIYSLEADVIVADAENLPFRSEAFDFIYSIGVIHHSPKPEDIVGEIFRTLKNRGEIRLAVYNRYSGAVYRYYLKYALLKGKPLTSLSKVLSENIESKGTKAYTGSELRKMFSAFSELRLRRVLLDGERRTFGKIFGLSAFGRILPNRLASFWFIEASKESSGSV